MKETINALFYWFVKLIVRVILLIWTRKEVVGLENVPKRGPVILASNHVNMLDPALLAVLVPRRIIFMGKIELWRTPVIGPLYSLAGFIPVRRFEADLAALRRAERALWQNQMLGMFPEGTRSRKPGLGKGQPGTAIIALRTGAPIVPVGVAGTETVSVPRSFFRLTRVRVSFGKPLELPKGQRIKTELVEECTERIMKEIAALLPEEYRGVYAQAVARQA
ncbi:MAG: lysophospholipid acyltransferase family protein [Dehalococcoidia bacterium]